MKKKKYTWLWVVLSLVWTALIFWHSSKTASQSNDTSLGLLLFVKKILPFVTHYQLRKLAHLVEFAVLGVFLTGSFYRMKNFSLWKPLAGGLFVALCDETIQLFVEGRSGNITDLWIDLNGVVVGSLVLFMIICIRKK